MMLAFKFLASGRVGPFSGFRWPEPGAWVHATGDLDACRSGIHACRTEDLPWWLGEELWVIELQGQPRREGHKIVAPAGRLQARVAQWTMDCAGEYAQACAWRARDSAVEALGHAGLPAAADAIARCETLDDLLARARRLADQVPVGRIILTMAGDGAVRALTGAAPTTAYIAAHAALRVGGPTAYAVERGWQARWLVERLGLDNLHERNEP
jgi:hypothetical protein